MSIILFFSIVPILNSVVVEFSPYSVETILDSRNHPHSSDLGTGQHDRVDRPFVYTTHSSARAESSSEMRWMEKTQRQNQREATFSHWSYSLIRVVPNRGPTFWTLFLDPSLNPLLLRFSCQNRETIQMRHP